MPHFFLTLTSNETSNLRWKEIEDIENFAMFFNNTFSWMDYLVECMALFCIIIICNLFNNYKKLL